MSEPLSNEQTIRNALSWHPKVVISEHLDPQVVVMPMNDLVDFITRYGLEQRKDEIGSVKLDYGPYSAETFIDGKPMPVAERYEQLEALTNQEAIKK